MTNRTPVSIITGYTRVLVQGDLSLVQYIIKSWPSAACVEFGARTEEFLATDYADVHPGLGVLVVAAWKDTARLINKFISGEIAPLLLPVKGRSVPASWVTWYCIGVRRLRSSSLLSIVYSFGISGSRL